MLSPGFALTRFPTRRRPSSRDSWRLSFSQEETVKSDSGSKPMTWIGMEQQLARMLERKIWVERRLIPSVFAILSTVDMFI